jgi:hypothetical protein
MKKLMHVMMAAALVAVPASQAQAGWKLVKEAVPVKVAKSTMAITPAEAWNRSSYRASKKGETWTLDGTGLNEVYFVAGLLPGEALYKDHNKKNNPLPLMGKNLQLTDIPEFYESSQRVAYNTSVYTVTGIEPVKFLGRDGVRFTYTFAVQGNPLQYKGIAQAAMIDGKLYLISFNAPELTYFDRDKAKAETIFASATL